MIKQLRSLLIASTTLIMLAIQPSWAQQGNLGAPGESGASVIRLAIPPGQGGTPPGQGGTPPGQGGTPPGQVLKSPEINVGAGGAGLTVLAIALLLAAERRSRSS